LANKGMCKVKTLTFHILFGNHTHHVGIWRLNQTLVSVIFSRHFFYQLKSSSHSVIKSREQQSMFHMYILNFVLFTNNKSISVATSNNFRLASNNLVRTRLQNFDIL
jgi:hypothetical protein